MKHVVIGLAFAISHLAFGNTTLDVPNFDTVYGVSSPSYQSFQCSLCHAPSGFSLFGTRYRNGAGARTAARLVEMQDEDLDSDTFTNREEIEAGSNPSDTQSYPGNIGSGGGSGGGNDINTTQLNSLEADMNNSNMLGQTSCTAATFQRENSAHEITLLMLLFMIPLFSVFYLKSLMVRSH